MRLRNFLKEQLKDEPNCHDGVGVLKNISLFSGSDFKSNLRFLNYTILPPGTSIGLHGHGNDEEVYIILKGQGKMEVDGEMELVETGDIIVNKPFGTHGLVNQSKEDLKILVFEVGI